FSFSVAASESSASGRLTGIASAGSLLFDGTRIAWVWPADGAGGGGGGVGGTGWGPRWSAGRSRPGAARLAPATLLFTGAPGTVRRDVLASVACALGMRVVFT